MVVEGDPAGATGDPTGGVPTASSWDAYLELVGAAAAEDEQELELCRILGDEPAAEAADDATSSQRYQVHFAPPTPPAAAHAPRKIATPPPRRRGTGAGAGAVAPRSPWPRPAQFAPHIPAPAPEAAHTPPGRPAAPPPPRVARAKAPSPAVSRHPSASGRRSHAHRT